MRMSGCHDFAVSVSKLPPDLTRPPEVPSVLISKHETNTVKSRPVGYRRRHDQNEH